MASCAIATPHATATEVAAEAVRTGGNAVDAAVAAALTLSVVYPHNTSIGGDLIALVRTPDGRIHCVNASGPAARRADLPSVAARYGGVMPTVGVHTITVPGAVPGLARAHALAGTTTWSDLVRPAAELARSGVPVSRSLARALGRATAETWHDEGMAAVFAPQGRPLTEGSTLVQPELATSLDTLADRGPSVLSHGELGSRLVTGLQRLGSDLSLDDLSGFAPEVTAPLRREHRGHQVWTSPPNTQGYQLLQLLGTVDLLPPGIDPHGADARVLAALWHRANQQRRALLADPRASAVDLDQVLGHERLQEAADAALHQPVQQSATDFPQPSGDTVAVVAADTDGYAACLVQSVFHSFGAAVLEPTTGILLHNRGAFFDLDPRSPNCLAGRKRPGHTLMPVMVTSGDRLAWVLGTMGGKAQPQIHYQVLRRLLDGATPDAAVGAPRWVVGGLGAQAPDEQVIVEADVPDEVTASLRQAGFPLRTEPSRSEVLGHAQVVASTPTGLGAGSDPRSDGSAVVVHGH